MIHNPTSKLVQILKHYWDISEASDAIKQGNYTPTGEASNPAHAFLRQFLFTLRNEDTDSTTNQFSIYTY